MTKEELRYEILRLLMKRPLRSEMLSRRIPFVTWADVDDLLRELVKEFVIIPRDRRFYIRDRKLVLDYLNGAGSYAKPA